jgi:hypothetical protein
MDFTCLPEEVEDRDQDAETRNRLIHARPRRLKEILQ